MATLQTYLESAKSAILAGSYDRAVIICEHVLAHFPKQIDGHCLLAEAYREKGNLDKADALFKQVLSADPENLIANWALSVIEEEQGDVDAAVWQIRRAYDVSPWHGELRKELGRLSDSRPRMGMGGLARVYVRQGLNDRAIDLFESVLEQDPLRLDIRVALAEVLCATAQREEAAKICRGILDDSPDCLKANLILGHLSAGQDKSDPVFARELLDRAVALDPENVVAGNLLPKLGLTPLLSPTSVQMPAVVEESAVLSDGDYETGASEAAPIEIPQAVPNVETTVDMKKEVRPGDERNLISVETEGEVADKLEAKLPTPGLIRRVEESGIGPESVSAEASELVGTSGKGEQRGWLDSTIPPSILPQADQVVGPAEKTEQAFGGADLAQLTAEYGEEWTSLLTEDIQPDAESEARLEAALADAKASQPGGGWPEAAPASSALSERPVEEISQNPSLTDTPQGTDVDRLWRADIVESILSTQEAVQAKASESQIAGEMSTVAEGESSEPAVSAPIDEWTRLLQEAIAQREAGQSEQAVDSYRALLKLAPSRAEEVGEQVKLLLASHPNLVKGHRLLGDAYMKLGRFQLAIEEYNWVLSKGRDKGE